VGSATAAEPGTYEGVPVFWAHGPRTLRVRLER
jgi:hypothetical protein